MELTLFKKNEEEMINEIVHTHGANLPARIEDVIQIFEFTDWKAKAWKIMADKMVKLEEQSESYNSALRSGQQWGIAALYAKKRIGEITREMPSAQGLSTSAGVPPKQATLKEQGLTHQSVSEAERIADPKNEGILEEVIDDAKKRGEIPTATRVLSKIRLNEAEGRAAEKSKEAIHKRVKETPKAVKDYLDVMHAYKRALFFALEVAKNELFPPESAHMIKARHADIQILMKELEEVIL